MRNTECNITQQKIEAEAKFEMLHLQTLTFSAHFNVSCRTHKREEKKNHIIGGGIYVAATLSMCEDAFQVLISAAL